MEIRKYNSIEDAFNEIIGRNKKYVLIRHQLKQNENIEEHCHKNVNEFVIAKNGDFEVKCNNESKRLSLSDEVSVIYLPRGSKHSLKNFGDKLDYFVVRDLYEN